MHITPGTNTLHLSVTMQRRTPTHLHTHTHTHSAHTHSTQHTAHSSHSAHIQHTFSTPHVTETTRQTHDGMRADAVQNRPRKKLRCRRTPCAAPETAALPAQNHANDSRFAAAVALPHLQRPHRKHRPANKPTNQPTNQSSIQQPTTNKKSNQVSTTNCSNRNKCAHGGDGGRGDPRSVVGLERQEATKQDQRGQRRLIHRQFANQCEVK